MQYVFHNLLATTFNVFSWIHICIQLATATYANSSLHLCDWHPPKICPKLVACCTKLKFMLFLCKADCTCSKRIPSERIACLHPCRREHRPLPIEYHLPKTHACFIVKRNRDDCLQFLFFIYILCMQNVHVFLVLIHSQHVRAVS